MQNITGEMLKLSAYSQNSVQSQLLEGSTLYICLYMPMYFLLMGFYPDQPEKRTAWSCWYFLCLHKSSLCLCLCWSMCICHMYIYICVVYFCLCAYGEYIFSLASGWIWAHGSGESSCLLGYQIQSPLQNERAIQPGKHRESRLLRASSSQVLKMSLGVLDYPYGEKTFHYIAIFHYIHNI